VDKIKILVVDDSKKDRLLLVKIFESNGYKVSEACNGIEALKSIEESKPDIIVSDILMPKMDGYVFLHKLKQYDEFKDIPFVYYTAQYLNKKDEEFAESLGASKFIIKPKEAKDLIDEIESVMAEHAIDRSRVVKSPIETDEEYFKQYSNRLVRKLEDKYNDLEKSEKKYRTIIDYSNDLIWTLDAQGNFTFYNKRSEELTGYMLDDWIGKSFAPLIHEWELQKTHNSFKRTMAGYPQQNDEITVIKKDGSDMILSVNTVPVFESGEVTGSISFARDITAIAKTKQALQESEIQYRNWFEGSPDAIFLADPESCTIIDANHAASKLLQKPIDEIIGLNQTQLHPSGMKEFSLDAFKKQIIGNNIHHPFETLVIRSDGIEVPIEIMTKIVTIKGKPVRQGIFRDITLRKKNEDLLKLNNLRMDALLELNQMTNASFSDIADFVLEKSSLVTKSEYGFIGLMNEDESAFTIHSWANVMDFCAVDGKPIEFPIEPTGIWSDVVRERKSIIVNDYFDPHTHKAGLPEGHVPVSRVMVIPTFEEDKIVAIAAVANKKTNYDDSDVRQITLLMDGMWKHVQRQKAEKKLRQAANEWAITFDSITDPVSIQDRDFKLVRVNRAYAKAMNADPEDLVGKFCFEVVHGTDECIPNCPHKQTLETKQPVTIEIFDTRLGKHLEVSTSPRFDGDEGLIGSVHIIHDITERKQAEKALQETNEYLDDLNKKLTASLTQRDSAIDELSDSMNYIETIMNTSVSGIFVVDEQGKFNFGNEAFSRILGWPMDELIGEPFMKVMPEDKHELMQKHWDDIQNGITEPYETVIVTKNGTRRDIFVSHKDLKMKGEKRYVVSINDITERKQAEEEKRNYLVDKTRTQLQNFVVSALPVFASGTTPRTRNMLVSKFAQNFEDNVLPQFKQEMDVLNESVAVRGTATTDQMEVLSQYLSWLQNFYVNLGAQPNIASDGLSGYIEFSKCHWSNNNNINPVFCFICRAMVLRSFSWTNLKGRANHSNSIADGSNKCRFDIVLLPRTDVLNSSK